MNEKEKNLCKSTIRVAAMFKSLFGRESVNMEMGALKIEDFTGGSDQTLGKKNPLLYII